jgi:hypothetical protein
MGCGVTRHGTRGPAVSSDRVEEDLLDIWPGGEHSRTAIAAPCGPPVHLAMARRQGPSDATTTDELIDVHRTAQPEPAAT